MAGALVVGVLLSARNRQLGEALLQAREQATRSETMLDERTRQIESIERELRNGTGSTPGASDY